MSVHPEELTGTEQAVLLVLMAECRPVPNARLKDFGPAMTAEQRKKLVRKDLIEVSGKPMVVTLSDTGWAMCRAIIGTDPPPGVTGQKRALYTVLKAIDRHLKVSDLALADVIAAATEQPPVTADDRHAVVDADDDLEGRVRTAYSHLVARPGGWVSLTRLRGHLADVSRDDVDATLRNLLRSRGISLIPEENQKVLTDADDLAAIVIGGEKNHLMAIR